MSIRIRFKWTKTHYKLIVTQRNGKLVEKLGTYTRFPDHTNKKQFEINLIRFYYWISVGALLSDSCIKLIKRSGLFEYYLKELKYKKTLKNISNIE